MGIHVTYLLCCCQLLTPKPQIVQEKDNQLVVFMSNNNSYFLPRVIIATASTLNSRIDCNNMIGVFRMYMSLSNIDVIKECVWTGRFLDANKEELFYSVYIYLCGLQNKLLKILDPDTKMNDKVYRAKL